MKIYLTDQSKHFPSHLQKLIEADVMRYSQSDLSEKISTIEISSKSFEALDFSVLFDYRIFPRNIMSSLGQWQSEDREMRVGDTIVQQVYIPPIKEVSQKIIFGVRIKEIFNEECKRGYSYETLEGHVEKGISTFTVEKQNDHCLFKIQTFSSPGNFLTKLLGPIFSIPYQSFCTNEALKNVRAQI